MGLLDHMVILFLISWETSILFSKVASPVCLPTTMYRVYIFPHRHQPFSFLFVMAIPVGVRWHLILVLMFISLWISDAENLFIVLLAINTSSLEKCLFKFFAYFLIGLFVLLVSHYWVAGLPCGSWISTMKYMVCTYFLPFHWLPFHAVDYLIMKAFWFNVGPLVILHLLLVLWRHILHVL